MPRKPKLGPAILKIERMSDGGEIRPVIVDDFTGEVIEPKLAPMPTVAPTPPQDVRDAENRQRADMHRAIVAVLDRVRRNRT
jgi:hypothetical protein